MSVPIYRWVDLWTQLMVDALQPSLLPKPKLVSGDLEVLGMDLRHHANVVSFTAYGLLSHNAQTQLVRITQSAYKVDVINGEQTWLLFNNAAPLLNAFANNQGLRWDNIPLLPTGDLLYSGEGKAVSDYNLMNKASAFFTDNANSSYGLCRVAPSDRHPIQLAEPIYLSNYKVDNGNLSWGDGSTLAIATKRISSLSELNIETISKSSQIFGLLRFDAGQWSVQPLAVTVQKKTIFTGQNAAKILKSPPKTKNATTNVTILRQPAEIKYKEELEYLASIDKGTKPFSWRLSPQMVRTFILGSTPAQKLERQIQQKWYGDTAIAERAIVTLASDRGLLLIGDPGTGKSWLAELLAAAICGNSTYVVQGTAGTTEDQIKYSWNVAMVIAAGQSIESLIPSPLMTAMQNGAMGRFEELTRCTSDVQDALISI